MKRKTYASLSHINMPYTNLCLLLAIILILFISRAHAGVIDDIPAGHWYEVPNSMLKNVAPSPVPPGSTGVKSVIVSWNGGVFDTKRNRLVVWGGGHTNYAGNEIYAFDLNTLQWERLTEPSSLDGWTDGDVVYKDGSPVSRHTYNYIEYIPPPYDKFFVGGGSALYWDSGYDSNTYYFDFDTNKWETLAEPILNDRKIGSIAVTDPATNKVWFHGAGNNSYLSVFDPEFQSWTARGLKSAGPGFIPARWSAAIDPVRRKLVAIGNDGRVFTWDLAQTGDITYQKLVTTGDTEIIFEDSPGFAFDPVSEQFVAWAGGADIYTLNLETAKWTRIPPAATNTTIPTNTPLTGTFGRFRYVPSKNVFICVNSVSENVYIYRLTTPITSTTPNKPAKPNTVPTTP